MLIPFFLLSCAQQKPFNPPASNFDSVLNNLDETTPDLMGRYHVPGVAIAIVDASGPKLSVNYGHIDDSESSPITGTTIFEGASLGKPLFAYAVLQNLSYDLDTPIGEYLERHIVEDSLGSLITMRQLLSHTSGLVFSEQEERRKLATEPGSQWQYSGLGYSVLQQAVEYLSGSSLEESVHEMVTVSLGMETTSYLPPSTESLISAIGHNRRGQRMERTQWSNANAASSLHTNASDYGRFLSTMLSSLQAGTVDRTYEEMTAPQIEVDKSIELFWGLGWAVAHDSGDTLFLHWGSNPGYKSLAIGSINQGIGMVVLTNGDNGLELATELVPIVFGKKYPFLRFYMLHPDD